MYKMILTNINEDFFITLKILKSLGVERASRISNKDNCLRILNDKIVGSASLDYSSRVPFFEDYEFIDYKIFLRNLKIKKLKL